MPPFRNSRYMLLLLTPQDIPEECHYSGWSLSNGVQALFDGVCADGFAPQLVEAYDEHVHRINPNDLEESLGGELVCVTCTLEKMLFRPRTKDDDRTRQVYVNIVKLRILKSNLGSPRRRLRDSPPPPPSA